MLLIVGMLAFAWPAFTSAPAYAALNHATVEKEFSVGSECSEIRDIAIVESTGTVYVDCSVSSGGSTIRKFNLAGEPVAFSGSASYIEGNEITGTPSSLTGTLGTNIAVDNSSVHNGFIYVTSDSEDSYIDVFNPAGERITSIPPPSGPYGLHMEDVDVSPNGTPFVLTGFDSPEVFVTVLIEYDTSFHEVRRIYYEREGRVLRVDSTGALWVLLRGGKLSRYEPDQFTTNLSVAFGSPPALIQSVKASTTPLFPDPLLQGPDLQGLDVDLGNNDLYVDRGNHIETYSAGTAEEAPHQNAPSFGEGKLTSSQALAVTADHHVYAATSGAKMVIFGPGDIVPDVTTPKAAVDDVGHTSAVVKAHIDLAGGSNVTSCQLQYGKTAAYTGPGSGVVPCSPDPGAGAFEGPTNISAELPALTTGTTYHYRFKAGNAKGSNTGIDRTLVPAFVLKVKTLAATEVVDHSAKLQGSFDPDGIDTSFHFEYGVDTTYGLSTPSVDAGAAAGVTPVEEELPGLPAGKVWHYRIVATNGNGTTYGEDRVFKTAGSPEVNGLRASEVTATSALLQARIDPVGYATEYRFEYGTTPEYGQAAPAPDGQIGPESGPTELTQQIVDLTPGVTYHFRVVATNRWGTTTTPDTTFDYAPPSCPNAHLRQQTISSYLPDCRAYELVSPGSAGAVQLWPSQVAWDSFGESSTQYGREGRWALNTGQATSPSRFAFFANNGVITGLDAPNKGLDTYLATRTNSGWVTKLPGLTASKGGGAGKECSESMQMCTDHGNEDAPYLFNADGEGLGQLPSNVKTIPGGGHFTGAQRMSGDFNHLLFSSSDVVFSPGGVSGGQGSAYDNDIATHTVTVISKLPGGADIPQDGSAFHAIEFPGVSPNGSHVLMQTPAVNGGAHLYMRVNDAVTYDVSKGAGVNPIGMTRSGSEVFFESDQRLTGDDNDESADIYMWSEATDSLTRISKGNGNGDSNDCHASWIGGCGAAALSTERGHPAGDPSIPGLDDVMAEENGDVYFYSPEQLDPARPGIPNQRNLYVYRNGAVKLVAVFEPGTQVNRMQISPDGLHAAMITASKLSSYDSRGYREMYTYDAETGEIRCASCDPSGLPPTADVEASQGGRFMTDDGRAFFASKDSLVPRDTDGAIIDVYEYVGGRPQLITAGFGARDFTGGGGLVSFFGSGGEFTGLEGVSRDGSDVFFSTFDTLVPQDRNGVQVKFYDARTGGGFAPPPELPPCAAADECHGAGSSPPAVQTIGTADSLGAGGNVASPRKPKHSKPKKTKKKSKRHHKGQRHD
ncbi:MAG TPA: hypothetical protein VII45_00205 [Solirubrobacterales bacterium]